MFFAPTACNDHRQKLWFSVSSHGRIIYMNDEKEENKTEDEEEREREKNQLKIRKDESVFLI